MELTKYVPEEINLKKLSQSDFPKIAKNADLMSKIIKQVKKISTNQVVVHGDARDIDLEENSVHLVVTSPPYWILKKYNEVEGQLAEIQDYNEFLIELGKLWDACQNLPGEDFPSTSCEWLEAEAGGL